MLHFKLTQKPKKKQKNKIEKLPKKKYYKIFINLEEKNLRYNDIHKLCFL